MSHHRELQAQSDVKLLAELRQLRIGSAEHDAVCEILVTRYATLVESCVRPYRNSPEPAEDLLQVGYLGLLKAINNQAFTTFSLDAPMSDIPDPDALGDLLGDDDPAVTHALDIDAVQAHLDDLPEREQCILMLRFYGNLTQDQIAHRLGISQMHVSPPPRSRPDLPPRPDHRPDRTLRNDKPVTTTLTDPSSGRSDTTCPTCPALATGIRRPHLHAASQCRAAIPLLRSPRW